MAHIHDEIYAQRVQNGDRAALDVLVERHYDALLGYLYRMTNGDRAFAEDIAQETFLRALRHINQFRPEFRFKSWLYAIATNLTRNHYASADTRRNVRGIGDDETLPTDVHDEPLDPFLEQDDERAVIAALNTLPDHQRTVVTLFYYQDFSLNEIAAALDIPVGTVKSRLSLGVKRLREWIKAIDKPTIDKST